MNNEVLCIERGSWKGFHVTISNVQDLLPGPRLETWFTTIRYIEIAE